MGDYHPISLVHGIIKIILKTLSFRLYPFMDKLVSMQQTSFIKGRFIGDDVLTAAKVIIHRRKSNHEGVILKLDIQKAFDSVYWNLLLDLLRASDFGVKWYSWTSNILSSSKIALLINGSKPNIDSSREIPSLPIPFYPCS